MHRYGLVFAKGFVVNSSWPGEPPLVGKDVQPLQSVKNYSNSRVRGHGQLGFAIWYRLGFKSVLEMREWD